MLATTTDELNEVFRDEVSDPLEGIDADNPDSENLWKEREVYRYMTEAVDAVAKQVQTLYRLIRLPVVATQQVVRLPKSVLDIRSARMVTAGNTLLPQNANQALYAPRDDYGMVATVTPGFFTDTGLPRNYVRDYDAHALRLVPTPTVDDTIEIQCDIVPGTPMAAGIPLLMTDTEDQRLLLTKMKALAYSKQDADCVDMERAEYFEKKFKLDVVERAVSLRRMRRASGVIAMEW
jgi:hypothetical protein